LVLEIGLVVRKAIEVVWPGIKHRLSRDLLAGLMILVSSFTLVFYVETRYPQIYGIDGPYYLLQMKAIASTGWIEYPDPPLAFYMLYPFYLAGETLGVKAAVSFYVALTSLIIYRIYRHLGGGLCAALLATLAFSASPYTLRLASDFLKNCLGLLFIASTLLVYSRERSTKASTLMLLASIWATALTHILDFGVVCLMSWLILVYTLIFDRSFQGSVKDASILALSSTATLAVLFAFPVAVGWDTGKIIGFVNDLMSTGYGVSPPIAARTFPIALLAVLAGLTAALSQLRGLTAGALAFSSSITLVCMNLPLIPPSWLFRFQLMNSILIPLTAPMLLFNVKNRTVTVLVMLAALAMSTPALAATIPRLRPSIPQSEYDEIKTLGDLLPEGSKIVVPNTKLYYWVKLLLGDRYVVLKEPQPMEPAFIVLEKTRFKPRPVVRLKPIYIGHHLDVYLAPPKPPNPIGK